MVFTLAINVDEIGHNLDDILLFLRKNNLDNIELRTIDDKNIANFTQEEVLNLKQKINEYNLNVCAIASPLFKWYKTIPQQIKPYDSFGFPCLLSDEEKIQSIQRTVNNAKILNVKKVRVFSCLHNNNTSVLAVSQNEIFEYCLNYALTKDIQLLIENEPICNIYTITDVLKILEHFPSLYLWLDVANFYQVGEILEESHLKLLLPKTRHIHLKDFVWENNEVKPVPLGQGNIPWKKILSDIFINAKHDISLSIEMHMKKNKIQAIEKSLEFVRNIYNIALHAKE